MRLSFSLFCLVLLSILFNVAAQLGLKSGVSRAELLQIQWSNFLAIGLQLFTNPMIILAILFYVCSFMIWLFVLARIEVSIAYPMVSLGYIVNAFAAYYLLGENLSFLRISGIIIILIGVFMVARS